MKDEKVMREIIADRLHGFLHSTADAIDFDVDYVAWMSCFILGRMIRRINGPDHFLEVLAEMIRTDDQGEVIIGGNAYRFSGEDGIEVAPVQADGSIENNWSELSEITPELARKLSRLFGVGIRPNTDKL